MNFQVGDQVVHQAFGLGEIIQLDEKKLYGHTKQYYVVQISDLTLWVPASETEKCSLRYPTPAKDFKKLFEILSGPPEQLSNDRFERKTQITERLKEGKLESICSAIRDLEHRRRSKTMNENDNALLERAQGFLLNEWSASLSIPIAQAKQELNILLGKDIPNPQ